MGEPRLWSDVTEGLPAELAERVRVVRDGAYDGVPGGEPGADSGGGFVLYWMHHAVRGHENPALDAAVRVADGLGLPVLVYQGLGGRHRFNSDRHHAFILEGARDCARELAERFPVDRLRHAVHVPADPSAASPLRGLAARAALVIAEEFPAPPFPAWTERLAERCGRPVWAVDSACVVPMRLVEKAHDRAFRFRDKTKKPFRARVGRAWREAAFESGPAGGAARASEVGLGFEPVDWGRDEIGAMIARCAIDHTVGPVPENPGGSRAGYARWEAFKADGLGRYHARRNDAALDPEALPVSRLSPYLHHGQVSPLRIAREAWGVMNEPPAASAREGAEKFIDELWVWRELSHNLCFHRWRELESLEVLPEWARDTLRGHARDRREVLSAERLSRGMTGDGLWDAAQRSLVVRGELHNNLRMTWGKALAGWTAGPSAALRALIDLNHRYALDGNDPNSYGGLLWCLGLFDRPFEPERAVLGSVRARPTSEHGRRLDVGRYASVTGPAPRRGLMDVAVIGGGMAGLICARTLSDHGHSVRVFDKGRGPGGRMSTRRAESGLGELRFDHGSQYFVARDERFVRAVEAWAAEGVAAPWEGSFVAVGPGGVEQGGGGGAQTGGTSLGGPSVSSASGGPVRHVGVPGMSGVIAHLAGTMGPTCEVSFGVRVTRVERRGHRWAVRGLGSAEDGKEGLGEFDAVVVAVPAPQAAELLADVPDLRARAESVSMRACWAAMLAYPRPLGLGFDGAFVNAEGSAGGPLSRLSWAAKDSGKPGRAGRLPPGVECWVAHGSPAWSGEHADGGREAATAALREGFEALASAAGADAGALAEPAFVSAHLWRYALVEAALPDGCVFDESLRIGACGDWCMGARVEGAYLSGAAMAGRLLGLPDRAIAKTLASHA